MYSYSNIKIILLPHLINLRKYGEECPNETLRVINRQYWTIDTLSVRNGYHTQGDCSTVSWNMRSRQWQTQETGWSTLQWFFASWTSSENLKGKARSTHTICLSSCMLRSSSLSITLFYAAIWLNVFKILQWHDLNCSKVVKIQQWTNKHGT